jgi:hypothetical protein
MGLDLPCELQISVISQTLLSPNANDLNAEI